MTLQEQFGGKGCVVTGAASGIGLAISRLLLEAGAVVFMADRDEEMLASAMEQLGALAGKAVPATVDVTDQGQVEQVIHECASRHGRFADTDGSSGEGRLLSRLPRQPALLGLSLGFAIAIVLVTLLVAIFSIAGIEGLSFWGFVLFKFIYTPILAFIVTRWVILRQVLAGSGESEA